MTTDSDRLGRIESDIRELRDDVRALRDSESERAGVLKAARLIGLLLGIAVGLLTLIQIAPHA